MISEAISWHSPKMTMSLDYLRMNSQSLRRACKHPVLLTLPENNTSLGMIGKSAAMRY
jgi:hypothetical protein